VGKIESADLQKLMSDDYKQAGTICWTADEFRASEHGRANAHVGLYEVHTVPSPAQPPSWWPSTPQTSAARPLAGLKVVDMTRIIAAPAITRGLAELGASVMRVVAAHLPDAPQLHVDLNWGKWTCDLDFRDPADLAKVKALILDADVVVSGYRPGVMEKWGLGAEDIFQMIKESGRERGIVVARENCYGWNGPWSYRSGWQQISDACCGVSMEFGRAMGNDEPVTPVFPNSDYCTGVAGLAGILDAITRRGEYGGSYRVDVALNYYSRWLVDSVGTYPPAVWEKLWANNGRRVSRHYHGMMQTLPAYMAMLRENSGEKLFKEAFFVERESKAVGETLRFVKPVLRWKEEAVRLEFNVGTRGNGVDAPRWPEDLMTEIVR